MTILDWIVFGTLIIYIIAGFISGFIQSLGSLFGTFLGIFISSRFYIQLGEFIAPMFGNNVIAGQVFAFIIIFVVTSRVVGLAAHIVYKTVSILPFSKIINRMLGALLGLVEGSLFLGAVFLVYTKLGLAPQAATIIADSKMVLFFLKIGRLIEPLFPLALRQLESII